MVFESGDPPYDYDGPRGPLRGNARPSLERGLQGPSGINLEQGQFVITAERRKFNVNAVGGSHILPTFMVYVHEDIPPTTQYEPKGDGSTLANIASVWIINHILESRIALDDLFDDYSLDGEFSALDMKRDWLHQLDPMGPPPSGYRRPDPNQLGVADGLLDTTNVSVLGGSGILFGLDFGEVMFNPYPYFSNNNFGDLHNFGNFRSVLLSPVWPAFQRTNGSLITLNGREPDDLLNADEYDVTEIANGRVRLDGYCFLSQSQYLIGEGNGYAFNGEVGFTFVSASTRPTIFPDASNLATTRVIVDPTPQPCGIYKIVVRNLLGEDAVPQSTIPSGLVSQWPVSGQTHPERDGHIFDINIPYNLHGKWYNNTEFEMGYQVYDDAMWITDVGSAGEDPSGLVVTSPFTGHAQWLRYAEQTPSTGSGALGGSSMSAEPWGDHVGLDRVGSIIHRVQTAVANGSTSAAGTLLIQQYNDALDYLGQIETDENPGQGASPFARDLAFVPASSSEWWAVIGTTPGNFIWRFDGTFTFIAAAGIVNIGTGELATGGASPRVADLGGTVRFGNVHVSPGNATFSHRGSGIWDADISNLSTSGVVTENCRLIDLAPVLEDGGDEQAFCTVYDMQDVSGSAHLIDGFYFLASWQESTSPFPNRLFLIRAVPRDDSSAPAFCVGFWDILGIYDLGTIPSSATRLDFAMILKNID